MDYNELLNITTRLGQMLLENGAEIYRVEESIQRMALAYGVKEVDVYAVPTTIIAVSYTHLDVYKRQLQTISYCIKHKIVSIF